MTSCNFKAPNGEKSILYSNLEFNFGPDKATQLWQYSKSKEFADLYKDVIKDKNGEPVISWFVDNIKLPESQVLTRMKAVAILQTKTAEQVFDKALKNNWALDKTLKELQIPKAQRELIISFGLSTLPEILEQLLVNYSFTVEVNRGIGYYYDKYLVYDNYIEFDEKDINNPEIEKPEFRFDVILADTGKALQGFNTKEEAKALADKLNIEEEEKGITYSDHYKGLGVPGGTNYAEYEIATPLITPSIKGHAQFATNNGIGWFRSDDKAVKGTQEEYFEEDDVNMIFKKVTKGGTPTKTRRILEVQSDLFQNGRDKKDLITKDQFFLGIRNAGDPYVIYQGDSHNGFAEPYSTYETKEEVDKALLKLNNADKTLNKAPNQFLQLLNKDNNWVTFFVKSIIQDSAKKGYEKVLFPVGNTAAKIEGHDNLTDFVTFRQERLVELQQTLEKVQTADSFTYYDQFYTRENSARKSYSIADKEVSQEVFDHEIAGIIKDIEDKMYTFELELNDAATGTLQISSIAKFYEEVIFNVLKKQGYNPNRITDEYNNGWYEVLLGENSANTFLYSNKTVATTLSINSFGTARNKAERLSYEQAREIVNTFYQAAIQNPGKQFSAEEFKIEGLKKPTSNGYTPLELAGIFSSFPIPSNIKFDPLFEALINNTSNYILGGLTAQETSSLLYSDGSLQEIVSNLRVPIRDVNGNKTGESFTAEQTRAVVETLVSKVRILYNKDENVKLKSLLGPGGVIINDFIAFRDKFSAHFELPSWITPEHATELGNNYQLVLNSWSDFVERAIYRLEAFGLKLKDRSIIHNLNSSTENDSTVEGDEGRGLRDWADSSFELDPKDTASSRIKLFIASIRDVQIGPEREPSQINLPFSDKQLRNRITGKDPIYGRKTSTIRTPEQVANLRLGSQYIAVVDGIKFRVTVDKQLTESDLTNEDYRAIAQEEGIELVENSLLLRLEEWRPRKDVLVPKENFLGFAELVDFDDVFQKLLEVLYDVPNNIEAYLQALETEGRNFKPVFLEVANRLRRESDQVKREFIKVMSKQYQEFSILLYNRRRDGLMDITPINANQGSATQSILKTWRENQKNSKIISTNQQGNLSINEIEAQKLVEKLELLNERYQNKDLPNVDTELKPFAKEILESNGIILPDAALDYLMSNMTSVTKNTTVAGSIHDQFKVSENNKPTGMFSSIVMSLGGLLEDSETSDVDILNNNPLYTENTTMNILAKLAYKFSPKAAAGSHYNSESKNIYAFGMNTHLSYSSKQIINNQEYRDKLLGTHLGKHSWLLKQLNNSSIAREKFQLQYVDGLKESYKKNAEGIIRPSMSSREQLLFALGQFQHQKSKYGNFLSLTHSDKSATPLFTGIEKFDTEPGEGLTKGVQQAIWETFLGEYERIKAWYSEVIVNKSPTKNDKYNKGGGLYYFIPQFNFEYLNSLYEAGTIAKEDLQLFWISKGVPNTRTDITQLKPLVINLFNEQWLQPEIQKTTDKLLEEGFNEGIVDYSYLVKNLGKVGLTMNSLGDLFYNNSKIELKEAMELFIPWAVKDFVTNYFLVHTALSSLFYGDPALSFKPSKDTSELSSVSLTFQEYQKRLAKDIAPGQDPTWDNNDLYYSAITLKDDERVHDYLNNLSKYNGAEINGTDAQELTTVKEHLYVMKSLGLLKDTVYNEMVSIIEGAQNGRDNYYEFTNPEHLSVIMQVMKPVSVSQDFNEVPGTAVIHYIKSSSMPLYPPMTAGYEIDKLRILMENKGIQRANFISAKKTGSPVNGGIGIFDKNGDISIDESQIDLAVQNISRAGFRIQQEVPYDEFKKEILTGSQMNKLFLDDVEDKTFNFKGEVLTGAEIKQKKETIRKNLIELELKGFYDRIGAELIDGKYRILDKSKLLAVLEDEAIARNYSPNEVLMIKRKVNTYLNDGSQITDLAIPLLFNPAADRFESLLMSLVKKVGQIYMPGKSYIQASSAGFKFKNKQVFEDLTSEDKNKIVWIKGYDGSELKTMTPGQPAQVLIPFNFSIQNAAGDYESVDVENYLSIDDAGNAVLDSTKIPKELLELIGFRIPTQKQNSMLPMQVVGFLPKTMGDVIVVPAAITKQMGSDFDVDKLYVYRRAYTNDKERFELSNSKKDSLLNDYFDIAWTVLTDDEMYEVVMQPLDTEDLKLEAKRAQEYSTLSNYYSPLTQLEDYQSQKDAKVMVGITSQFVTFNSWIQDKNLQAVKVSDKSSTEVYMDENDQQSTLATREPSGIMFIAEKESVPVHAYKLSGKAIATYINEDTGELYTRNRIDDAVSIQSEVLDHAKNRTIDKLNINLNTIAAAEALIALASEDGVKPSWKHAALFLRQPIIVQLSTELSRSGDSLSTSFESDLVNRTIDKLTEELLGSEELTEDYLVIDINRLKDNLDPSKPVDKKYQAGMLQVFKRLNEIGKEMARIQRVFNQDPKGPGKNMIEAFDSINNRERVLSSEVISGVSALLDTEQGFIHTTELDVIENTMQDILPYAGIQEITSKLADVAGRLQFSVSTQREIAKAIKSYIFSNPELGLTTSAAFDRYRLLYGTDTEQSLAQRVWQAQQNTKNYFLKRLQPQLATTPNTPSYVFYLASKTSVLDDQENMAAFMEGLIDPNTKELFEDLVRYAYITGGSSSSFNFIRYIPADFLAALPFASKLREVAERLSSPEVIVEYTPFIEQWVRHNPQLVRKVTPEMIVGETNPGEKFKLKIPDSTMHPTRSIVNKVNNIILYPEYLSFYNKDSNSWNLFKQEDGGVLDYRRIDTLGNNQIDEYSYSNGYERSILTENRALIEPLTNNIKIVPTVEEEEIYFEENHASLALNLPYEVLLDRTDTIVAIAELSENENVNPALSVAAEYISAVMAEFNAPLSMIVTDRLESNGRFSPVTGLIEVSPKRNNNDPNELASTIVHEALHSVTSMFTFLPESKQKQYTKAYNALLQLKEVQQEALNLVLKTAKKEGFSKQDLENALTYGNAINDMHTEFSNMYYLTRNYDEFLSGIFENKSLQLLLNMQKSKIEDNTILGKIISILEQFLKAIGEVIGLKIKNGSVLEVGLKRSFAFVEEVRALRNNLTRSNGIKQTLADTYFTGTQPYHSFNGTYVWAVKSLTQAKKLVKDINKDLPMMKAVFNVKSDGVDVSVSFRELYSVKLSPKEREATNPIDKVYGKVQEQMAIIRASIAQNKKNPDVLRQNQLLANLRLLANDLKATQDIEKIKDLANYQIAWAQKIRDKFISQNIPVSKNQIMTSYRLLGVWTNILDILYNNSDNSIAYDPEFSNIQGKAETLHNEFSSVIMRKVFKHESKSEITTKDFAALSDMPAAEAKFLDVSRAKSKVTQEVALTIQDTHRQYLEDGQTLIKEIASFEKQVKEIANARGLKPQDLYETFMQTGSDWGLVTRYSPEFHKWKAGLRNTLHQQIEDAETNIGDLDLRSTAIRKAYDKYWRSLEYKAGFINSTIVFNEDGTMSDSKAAEKYKARMVKEYGEALTNELLEEARVKHVQYLQDKEDIFDMYDVQVEEGLMEAEEAEEAKASWELENSPVHKLSSKVVITSSKYLNLGERYLVLVPHIDSKSIDGVSFFDENFQKLQQDKELWKVYSKVQDFMETFKSNLPYFVSAKLGDNFLAAIKKELITSIADVPSYLRGAPARLINDLTASSYEEFMMNKTEQQIPILYTDNPFTVIPRPKKGAPQSAWDLYNKQREEQTKNYTKDLPRILELFGLMSLHYKNFSQARDAIELGEEIIKKVDSDIRKGNRQIEKDGKIVTIKASLENTLGALQYTKDVLMFKRSQNLQGALGDSARKKDPSVEKKLKELKADLQDLEDQLANNDVTPKEYTDRLAEINNEINKYDVRKFYASKIGDKLITWTQLKAISYNPLSAINNLAFGLISAIVHSNGRQDFNGKDFRQAFTIMLNSTGRSLGLARITGNDGAMHKTAEKILNIMDRMNIMGEMNDTQFKNSNLEGHKKGLKAALQPYQMLRTGDYFIKGLVMVAMLKHHKVSINGQETDLWKAINQEGVIEGVDVDWAKLRNKIIAVNKIIMGNQDKSSPIWAKKNILFRLIGQFRLSWFSEGIASRFEDEREDIQLGRIRKGRYRTYADLGLKQSVGILSKQLLSILPGVNIDVFNNARLKSGKHFTDTDKANMRRNLAEIGFFLMLFGVSKVLGALASGDDEEKKKWFTFWMNMATRSYQDVALYSNPSIFDTIIGTPAPALSTIRDVQKFIKASIKLATDDDYTAGEWFRKLTRAGFIPQTTLFNRYETMVNKDLSNIQR